MDQTSDSTILINPTSFQLPPNLLNNPDIDLYKHTSDVIDKALSETFFSEINKLKNLYNPQSQYYDPEYILELLGATTLSNLLSDITDKVSLSMIVGNIYNIKGTKTAFEAILKLIKLNYKQLIYTQLPNGCTDVTIIMDQAVRIDISDITALIRFAKEVFPLCLTLGGITNCIVYSSTLDYSGYRNISLGQHLLDRNFTLDLSKLDTSYGKTITSPDGSISVLICNPNYADMPASAAFDGDSIYGINISSQFRYQLAKFQRLDFDYILDRQTNIDYFYTSTAVGTLTSHDMLYSGYNIRRSGVTQNISQFRLNRDNLDRTMLRRLDGVQAQVNKKGLDYTIYTDRGALDADATPDIIRFDRITQRNITSDANVIAKFLGSSSDIKSTSADVNCTINLVSDHLRTHSTSASFSYPQGCLDQGIISSYILDRGFKLDRDPTFRGKPLKPLFADTRAIRSSSEMIYAPGSVTFEDNRTYRGYPSLNSIGTLVSLDNKLSTRTSYQTSSASLVGIERKNSSRTSIQNSATSVNTLTYYRRPIKPTALYVTDTLSVIYNHVMFTSGSLLDSNTTVTNAITNRVTFIRSNSTASSTTSLNAVRAASGNTSLVSSSNVLSTYDKITFINSSLNSSANTLNTTINKVTFISSNLVSTSSIPNALVGIGDVMSGNIMSSSAISTSINKITFIAGSITSSSSELASYNKVTFVSFSGTSNTSIYSINNKVTFISSSGTSSSQITTNINKINFITSNNSSNSTVFTNINHVMFTSGNITSSNAVVTTAITNRVTFISGTLVATSASTNGSINIEPALAFDYTNNSQYITLI